MGPTYFWFQWREPGELASSFVPVKPLAEAEAQVRQAYRDALPRRHARLEGA